jgi:hypothetical protein
MRTIVWDIDDVLNNLTAHWLAQHRARHPGVTLEYSALTKNAPHELLGMGFDDYLKSLDEFRASIDGMEQLTPNPLILAWLREHGSRYRHIALTARPTHAAGAGAAWTMNHFGAWIRSVAFVPLRKPSSWPDYDLKKVEYIEWFDRDAILIDDQTTNVMEVKAKGLNARLYPQPWNASPQTAAELLKELAQF